MSNDNSFSDIWDSFEWNTEWPITDTPKTTQEQEFDLKYWINESPKGEFSNFLQRDTKGQILELLTDEGINILSNYEYHTERINYIIEFSPHKEKIVKDPQIIDLILKDISSYYAQIRYFSLETSLIIFNKALEKNDDDILKYLFTYLSTDAQDKVLDRLNNHKAVLQYLILVARPSIVNRIINERKINLADPEIRYDSLFAHAKEEQGKSKNERNTNNTKIEEITINPSLLTKEVAEAIFNKYHIFKVRNIINNADYCTDTSYLNRYIKNQESAIIESSANKALISPYKEIYELLIQINQLEQERKYKESDKLYRQLYNLLNNTLPEHENEVIRKAFKKGEAELLEELEKLSNFKIANLIIDYHFEENYHNIMIDIEELLNLHFSGNISLSEEKLYLYQDIRNIDCLSRNQQMELHKRLKNINMIEMFYDDMSYARTLVRQALKDAAITKSELEQYRDAKLSEEYGIDVYNIEDNPFFAIVKSGRKAPDQLPTGHSFSLVGNGGIATWQDTGNYVYDSEELNPEQIIHIYPFDSFTLAKPNSLNSSPTTRINTLMMPDELVEYSYSYNEILILEQGKQETDIDKSIPRLKRIAKFCVDQITEEDIREAELQGIGIMLINSKKCSKSDNKERGLYRHRLKNHRTKEDIVDYLVDQNDIEKYEAKR